MVDANQVWDIEQAIEWMKQLAEFKPLWIEEPTSPDDILGHATISKVNLQNVDRSNIHSFTLFSIYSYTGRIPRMWKLSQLL
jgi:hypothetical protein